MAPAISLLSPEELAEFREHFARHRAESGQEGLHFMPFAPDDPDGPRGLDAKALALPLTAPGWQRCFLARIDGRAIGHVDLKGGALKVQQHRCELGIGIEAPYRRAGLGRRLMEVAIDFCRREQSLDWLDLRVFAHNTQARALYKVLGFRELGVIEDCMRIGGQSIDDVLMTLPVK